MTSGLRGSIRLVKALWTKFASRSGVPSRPKICKIRQKYNLLFIHPIDPDSLRGEDPYSPVWAEPYSPAYEKIHFWEL